ncbi:EamA family transporter RarD [Sporosarcina sp. G11-34]|uniref:EamA family transporter RarD n=1 Tax=Sporosarcina sp. G11-34 TaxID=2849605 RepID=UPI0022A8EDDE|nr:EamA family transporter RarD [Sporosarcina sp. G11-34]MCZ2257971.1 EamA family transporter RarD [Sporosarcina sp. G11-34]
MQTEKSGIFWAIGAYLIWGLMPMYWKSLEHVASAEILVGRIVWAFVLTLIVVLLIKNGHHFKNDIKILWSSQRDFWSLFFASVLVSSNWFIYIWAVNHNFIVQTSLGYYINPLISVLLGVFFLKEKLAKAQQIAFVLATIGVIILTVSYGEFPWLAFTLAITFAVYGLIKKQIKLDPLRGLTIETLFIVPVAVIYYIWLFKDGHAAFLHIDLKTDILLILTGAATALPLVMYAKAVQKIPLYMAGFLQYIAPTMMLFIGVVIYDETFGKIDLLSFAFIWSALLLFTVSKVIEAIKSKGTQEA